MLYYQTGEEYPPLNIDMDLWETEKEFYRYVVVMESIILTLGV